MNTEFPYGRIDYASYFDRYMEREDAVRRIPTPQELKELARKSIVREQLVLETQPQGTLAQEGDTLVLRTVSELPKFNKPRVTVTLGRGLYDRELEAMLVGLPAGGSVTATLRDKRVDAAILEIKRKVVPEPTDEMVRQLEVKNDKREPISTVAEYEAYIAEQKTSEALSTINYYVTEMILKDYPISEYDEEDIKILGQLERKTFRKLFLEENGVDVETATKEQMQELLHVDSMDDFIAVRREWYQVKIQQCCVYLNILELPCEGENDPLDHYEVLSELTQKMWDKIKTMLLERSN